MKKQKKEVVIWLVVLVITIIVLILGITSQKAYAAETLPSDILKKFGFTDSQILNKDNYEYHFMFSDPYSGDTLCHVFSDVPIKIRYEFTNSSYRIYYNFKQLDGGYNIIGYHIPTKSYLVKPVTDGLVCNFSNADSKNILVEHNYIPFSYQLNTYPLNKIFYVGGSIGIQVSNNSLEDLGYSKNSIFFFQGTFAPDSDVSPISPSDPTPIDDGNISDGDKSWFGGLFGGIEESIVNLATTLESGIINAFQSIADFILNGIESIADFILNGIEVIFVPDTENMTLKIDEIKSYFSFVDGIKLTVEEIRSFFENVADGEVPSVTVNLSRYEGKYNIGDTAEAIDLSWYSRYKPFVDNLIVGFVYITFLFNLFRRLPDIIAGAGAVFSPSSYSKVDMYIEDKGGKK